MSWQAGKIHIPYECLCSWAPPAYTDTSLLHVVKNTIMTFVLLLSIAGEGTGAIQTEECLPPDNYKGYTDLHASLQAGYSFLLIASLISPFSILLLFSDDLRYM